MTNFTLIATSSGSAALTGADLGSGFWATIIILVIWTLIWKGLALWNSARNGQNIWFIIMLVVNTVGILEIIYLLTHREQKDSATPPTV